MYACVGLGEWGGEGENMTNKAEAIIDNAE